MLSQVSNKHKALRNHKIEKIRIGTIVFLAEWLILLSCFGYPIQALTVIASKSDSYLINIGFRAGYLGMSLAILLLSLPGIRSGIRMAFARRHHSSIAAATPLLALVFFWIIYGIRLVYELEYQDWRMQHYSDFYIYSWAFGCSMIPAIAVLVASGSIKIDRFIRNMILILAISNTAIVYGLWHDSPSGLRGILGDRMTITLPVDTGRPDQSLLNPITIGLYGSWLVLAVLSFVLFSKKKMPVWVTLLLVLAFLLGLFNLVASASRGPLAGLLLIAAGMAVVGIITMVTRIRKYNTATTFSGTLPEKDDHSITHTAKPIRLTPSAKPSRITPLVKLFRITPSSEPFRITPLAKLFRITSSSEPLRITPSSKPFRITPSGAVWTIVLVALLTIGTWKIRSLAVENFAFLDRIEEMILEQQDGQGNIRQAIWKRAWYQFTINPIFGDSIINDVGYFYSHNIFMDALMSVGIVGTIPFLVWFSLSFWYFIRLPAESKRQLSVLFVAYLAALLLSMTSGGLFTVPEVWILSAAVITLSQKEERREKGEGGIDN